MLLHLTDLCAEPLHRQIYAQISAKVLAGDLSAGGELPSTHTLARQNHVNANTVERAYWELAREGLVASRDGKTFTVNALKPEQLRISASSLLPGVDEQWRRAQRLQNGLLPKDLPSNSVVEVAAHAAPAQLIGGDYYDCIPLDAHRFALVIADACGHGLPGALLITQIQAVLKNAVAEGYALTHIMTRLNHHVHRYSAKNFVTLFYGVFDQHTGVLKFANAGHHPPLLVRAGGKIELLAATGPALGVLCEYEHAPQSVATARGDCILFYTDGVTEAMNAAREEYGEHRLLASLFRHRERPGREIVQQLMADLRAFEAPEAWRDDKTLMTMKIVQSTFAKAENFRGDQPEPRACCSI